jgi:hypothetical protein
MPRYYLSALFSLLLLLATACSNKKDPAPSLQGAWTQQSTETNEYNADGSERSKSGLVASAQPATYTFTATQLTINDPIYFTPLRYTYTHTSNILTLTPAGSTTNAPFDQTIVSLERSKLILQDKRANQQGGQTVTIFHLVRQQ